MSVETEVVNLTTQTTALLAAVNVGKATLDLKVAEATLQAFDSSRSAGSASAVATVAEQHKFAAAASAAQALAVYGTSNAMQAKLDEAKAQSQLAQTAAASASSILSQDLSAVSAALHRSPNAVTAMCIWDMATATDGGAFIDKLGHTSLYNAPLNGTWRGQVTGAALSNAETTVRATSGAATGDYFQYAGDGKPYKLNAGAGTAQTTNGNKAKCPRMIGAVCEALGVFLYDLTSPGQPLWRHLPIGANEVVFAAPTSISAAQATLAIGTASGLLLIDIAADRATKITTGVDQKYKGFLATAGAGWY